MSDRPQFGRQPAPHDSLHPGGAPGRSSSGGERSSTDCSLSRPALPRIGAPGKAETAQRLPGPAHWSRQCAWGRAPTGTSDASDHPQPLPGRRPGPREQPGQLRSPGPFSVHQPSPTSGTSVSTLLLQSVLSIQVRPWEHLKTQGNCSRHRDIRPHLAQLKSFCCLSPHETKQRQQAKPVTSRGHQHKIAQELIGTVESKG